MHRFDVFRVMTAAALTERKTIKYHCSSRLQNCSTIPMFFKITRDVVAKKDHHITEPQNGSVIPRFDSVVKKDYRCIGETIAAVMLV